MEYVEHWPYPLQGRKSDLLRRHQSSAIRRMWTGKRTRRDSDSLPLRAGTAVQRGKRRLRAVPVNAYAELIPGHNTKSSGTDRRSGRFCQSVFMVTGITLPARHWSAHGFSGQDNSWLLGPGLPATGVDQPAVLLDQLPALDSAESEIDGAQHQDMDCFAGTHLPTSGAHSSSLTDLYSPMQYTSPDGTKLIITVFSYSSAGHREFTDTAIALLSRKPKGHAPLFSNFRNSRISPLW